MITGVAPSMRFSTLAQPLFRKRLRSFRVRWKVVYTRASSYSPHAKWPYLRVFGRDYLLAAQKDPNETTALKAQSMVTHAIAR